MWKKSTPHPTQVVAHETSAAFVLEGLRLGENCESHWPARIGGDLLEAEEREPVELGWRVMRAGPAAAWCVSQFPWTPVDATGTSEALGYPRRNDIPC